MDRKGIERDLEALTRRDLIELASELKIVGRHRMNKDHLIQVVLLAHIYRSLPESLDMLHLLTRTDLLRLCEMMGVEAKKTARKSYFVERIRAQGFARIPEEHRQSVEQHFPKEKTITRGRPEEPHTGHLAQVFDGVLPQGYGETRVVLLPIDPYLVHVYWDISQGDSALAKRLLEDGSLRAKAVLRFYDMTSAPVGSSSDKGSFDVEIALEACNWYVRLLSPEKSYVVELGLLDKDGRFQSISRSNAAETPPDWPCEKVGERIHRVVEREGRVHVTQSTETLPGREPHPMPESWEDRPSVRDPPEERGTGIEAPWPRETTPGAEQTPVRRPQSRGQQREPDHLQNLHPVDGGKTLRQRPAGEFEHRKWQELSSQRKEVRSRDPSREKRLPTDVDLSVLCEELFVSGLSSRQPGSGTKGDGEDGE